MGLSFGASGGGTSGTDTKSGTGTTTNTYSPWQTLLQGNLGSTFQTLLQSLNAGTESPGVQSLKTQSADQINKTSAAGGDRVSKFLAARGFGSSGASGNATLQEELGRQSELANNESNFAGLQLNQNQGFLTDALLAAFNSMGKTTTENSTENQNTSQWGAGAGASVGIPGIGG